MQLPAPLHRDQTQVSIQSRELSDPHAYSMVAPIKANSPLKEEEDQEDIVWPLRPSAALSPCRTERRSRSSSEPSVKRTSMHTSIGQWMASRSSSRHTSSTGSSATRVGSTSPDGKPSRDFIKSLPSELPDTRPAPVRPTTEDAQCDFARRLTTEPAAKRMPVPEHITALPTIETRPSPAKVAFLTVQRFIRSLQEVPCQPVAPKDFVGEKDDVEGQPIVAFTPGKGVYMAFATLAILTIMVALDSTALSVALPACDIDVLIRL